MKLFSYRNLRILLLFILLMVVAIAAQEQRLESTDWIEPLDVIIYPINGDGEQKTAAYITKLKARDFSAIDSFFAREGKHYQLLVDKPVQTRLGMVIDERPPAVSMHDPNPLKMLVWSLRLRYWAWRITPDEDSVLDSIQIFVIYQQGEDGKVLDHSLGLQKGLLGVVNAYARVEQNKQNNIVIAHELLHTVGASDKYDQNGNPVYPHGYAQPGKKPRYPQKRAEIMAGRVAITAGQSEMPLSLHRCVVGEQTAREINWLEGEE